MRLRLITASFLLLLVSVYSSRAFSQEDRFLQAIQRGGEWFLNNQNASFLYYQYDTSSKTYPVKSHILRETASLWAIAKLARFLDDERFELLAAEGFRYFETAITYDNKNDFYFLNVTFPKIKLGYSAFIILSLLIVDFVFISFN